MTSSALITEQQSPSSKGLDSLDNHGLLAALWDGQIRAVAAVESAIPQISDAADAIVDQLINRDGRLIYTGAGSSGLLAIQDGMELSQTFNWPPSRLVFMMAGGDEARLTLAGSIEDDAEAAIRDFAKIGLQQSDVVIAVAASGTTPYTVSVLKQARDVGALSIGIANNPETDVLRLASFPILLGSGPEVIVGSTRMGAGTAQKAALGMLSSLVMTRLGHIVDGWMVSLIADNDKLKSRAMRMVSDIANCSEETAHRALEASNGVVKQAVLIALGASVDEAITLLEDSNGQLRTAMEKIDIT